MFQFPNEGKVFKSKLYAYQYRVNGKTKKEGFAKGKDMINMIQYKHHNVNSLKEFEFRKVF